MNIEIERSETGQVVVRPEGRLDADTAPELKGGGN